MTSFSALTRQPHVAVGVAALRQHMAHHGPDLLRHVCTTVLKSGGTNTVLVNSVLLLLLSSYGPYARESFVARVLRDEIAAARAGEGTQAPPFFTSDTPGTRLLAGLYRVDGAQWLTDTLVPLYTQAAALSQPGKESRAEYISLARTFLQRLFSSGPRFPAVVARVLEQAAVLADSLAPTHGGQGMSVLVALVVQRCLVPAIVSPQKFGVAAAQPSAAARTFLTRLSKLLQDAGKKVMAKSGASEAEEAEEAGEEKDAETAELVAAQVGPMECFLKFVRSASKADDNLALSKQQAALLNKSAEIEHALLVTYNAIEANARELEASTCDPAVLSALFEVLKAAPKEGGLQALPPMSTHDPRLVAAQKDLDEFLLAFRAALLATGSGSKVMSSIAASNEQLKKQLEQERQQSAAQRANVSFMRARIEALAEQIARETGKPVPQELFVDAPECAPVPVLDPSSIQMPLMVPVAAQAAQPAASSLPVQALKQQTPLAATSSTENSSPLLNATQRSTQLTRSQPILVLARPALSSPPTAPLQISTPRTPQLDEQAQAKTQADLCRCQVCVSKLAQMLGSAQTPQQVLVIANVERELSRVQTAPLEEPVVFQSVGELVDDVRSVATLTMSSSSIVRIRDLLPAMIDQTKMWISQLQTQELTDPAMRARIDALTAFLIEVTGPANSVFAATAQQAKE